MFNNLLKKIFCSVTTNKLIYLLQNANFIYQQNFFYPNPIKMFNLLVNQFLDLYFFLKLSLYLNQINYLLLIQKSMRDLKEYLEIKNQNLKLNIPFQAQLLPLII